MDSLRAQLAETQGALTERDKKFRQLKAEHLQELRSWSQERSTLETRIKLLEAENLRLRGVPPAGADNPGKPERPEFALTQDAGPVDQQRADGRDKIAVPRSRMKQAEAQFEKLVDEVTEKTGLIGMLEAKLAQSSPVPIVLLNDDQIVARWNRLREQIRVVSLERLSKPFPANLVSEKFKGEFAALSPHWKTYASTSNVTCYIFRALIWRYLLRYFKTPCRACGRETSNKIRDAADAISRKASDTEYQDWRIRTATLVHKFYPIDKGFIEELTTQIAEAITPLLEDTDVDGLKALKASLRSIVTTTAEISAEFDRCRVVVLMSNHPGSNLTHGFPYVETVMDMRAKLSSQGVVDLMVTPTLLKKDVEYSVLVKADVIC